MKTAAFVTLGCKINHYETQAIREEVLELGYREVSHTEPADVYVVNTCSVTAMSGTKSRKYVQRVARTNPEARVVVVGCSTPSEREQLANIPQVAVLAGNEEKTLVASYLDGGWKPGEPFPDRAADIFSLNVSRYTGRTRANVKVQDGCNSFCSFCVIPFLRGRSRSRHPDAVVEEVQRLVSAGFVEVVVTGVHLQDYGEDLSPPISLGELLGRLPLEGGLRRLRLSSISPKSFDDRLYDVLEHPVFCRHFHVPLQAGSDRVLKAMRRDYTVDEFAAVLDELERRLGRLAISTDVIVGHPGETREDFEQTLAACRRFRFSKIHVFPYSKREDTLASKLDGFVDPLEVRERAAELRELANELALESKTPFVGETVEVLVEGDDAGAGDETGKGDRLTGFSEHYLKVRFDAPSVRALERFPGTLQPVRIVEAAADVLTGVWSGEISETA